MITELGTVSIGEVVPAGLTAIGAANASLSAQLPELEAKLEGLLAAQAGLIANPPSLVTQVAALTEMIVAVQAAIALGVPDVQFQLAAVVEQVADITASIGELEATVTLVGELSAAFGAAGLTGYLYQGTAAQMHADIRGATQNGVGGGGPNDQVTAVLFAASAPATITAMSTVFGVP